MRKILRQKFWSLGTNLGSLGPGSQGDLGLGFNRLQFLVIQGPYECPELMACQETAESLKLIAAWCGITFQLHFKVQNMNMLYLPSFVEICRQILKFCRFCRQTRKSCFSYRTGFYYYTVLLFMSNSFNCTAASIKLLLLLRSFYCFNSVSPVSLFL